MSVRCLVLGTDDTLIPQDITDSVDGFQSVLGGSFEVLPIPLREHDGLVLYVRKDQDLLDGNFYGTLLLNEVGYRSPALVSGTATLVNTDIHGNPCDISRSHINDVTTALNSALMRL